MASEGEIVDKFRNKFDMVVQTGPFAGMRYLSEACGSALIPKLIGCYEEELHDVLLNDILTYRYHTVLNIGCGEGYYAVGLALRLPQARVFAFDADAHARNICKKLAALNQVEDRVVVAGAAEPETLNHLISEDRVLVVCDVEGAELEILRFETVPRLRNCDILVELHDFLNREISETIQLRFADTHRIQVIHGQQRAPNRYAVLSDFSEDERVIAVNEIRPELMDWAFMKSKGVQKESDCCRRIRSDCSV